MCELIVTTTPLGLVARRVDECFVVAGPGPVGPVPSAAHPMLYCDSLRPPLLDESNDALNLQAKVEMRPGDRRAVYELPVPLRVEQSQRLRSPSWRQPVEVIWNGLLSRPSRRDAGHVQDDPNRRQFQLLTGLVGRMQDFDVVLSDDEQCLPWHAAFLRWLEPEEKQDPTMDVLVRHAEIHRARWADIAERPKRLLNRTRQLVGLSRVQELDTHCMAWLSQQPGRTMPERADTRQRILALARYENLNTLENRVFRDLLERTDAAARDYIRQNAGRRITRDARGRTSRYTMVERYALECRRLAHKLAALGVNRLEEPVQPNFVLMQDDRYRHVWIAWKEIVARERWYDDLWRWQRRAWAEFAKMACGVALLAVLGGEVEFASPMSFRMEHRRGQWVKHDDPLAVLAFQEKGFVIEVFDGHANEFAHTLPELGASAWLRFSDLQSGAYQYIAVWTVLALATTASLPELITSAEEAIECLQQAQSESKLAGGLVLQAEADPELDAEVYSNICVTGISFGPFDRHLARGLEMLGEEIIKLVRMQP